MGRTHAHRFFFWHKPFHLGLLPTLPKLLRSPLDQTSLGHCSESVFLTQDFYSHFSFFFRLCFLESALDLIFAQNLFLMCHLPPAQAWNFQAQSIESWLNSPFFNCLYPSHVFPGGTGAAAKSLQSCPTLCNPTDGSPPGSAVPGILQARTLEWVAISFSNAWKWKVKVKLLSRVQLLATPWTAAYQAPPSMGLSRQEYWSGVPLPSPPGGTRGKETACQCR